MPVLSVLAQKDGNRHSSNIKVHYILEKKSQVGIYASPAAQEVSGEHGS